MNTIESTIKSAPLFKGKTWRKQIEFVRGKFKGEELQATAFSKNGMQQLYVFENRVYLNEIQGLMSNNEKTIPLSGVSSVTCNSKALYADIVITTSGANIVIEDVVTPIAQEVSRIIESSKIKS